MNGFWSQKVCRRKSGILYSLQKSACSKEFKKNARFSPANFLASKSIQHILGQNPVFWRGFCHDNLCQMINMGEKISNMRNVKGKSDVGHFFLLDNLDLFHQKTVGAKMPDVRFTPYISHVWYFFPHIYHLTQFIMTRFHSKEWILT